MMKKDKDYKEFLNPESLVVQKSFVEPAVKDSGVGTRLQFERQGYFIVDEDTTSEKLVFNRIITLKDAWAFKK